MALYRATCYKPPQGERIDGQIWTAPGPGAQIRGWSSPRRSASVWFRFIDRVAVELDALYPTLIAGEKASWDALQIAHPFMAVCSTDRVGPYIYHLLVVSGRASVFIELPWGRLDWEHTVLVGMWGRGDCYDQGGGIWVVYVDLTVLCDVVDWTDYGIPAGGNMLVAVGASVGGAVRVNGQVLAPGFQRYVSRRAEAPPCRIHRV